MINIFTDGGARGNPGQAAIGVYITDQSNKKIDAFGEKIGHATNNVAEYRAVLGALDWLIKNKKEVEDHDVSFFVDSLLIVCQINGTYKVKDPFLKEHFLKVREKEKALNLKIKYSYIPREQNKKADQMVNMALDNKL